MRTGRRAVFLDRDGTIIEDVGYPRDPAAVTVIEGALPALGELRERGYALVVASNQSGLARGLVTASEAAAVHDRFVALCAAAGVRFDAIAYCPHGPGEHCACRKPAPGMLLDAAQSLDIDLTASFMVGDKVSDVEAGHRAGCRSILLRAGTSTGPVDPPRPPSDAAQGPDGEASNWADVSRLIDEATRDR